MITRLFLILSLLNINCLYGSQSPQKMSDPSKKSCLTIKNLLLSASIIIAFTSGVLVGQSNIPKPEMNGYIKLSECPKTACPPIPECPKSNTRCLGIYNYDSDSIGPCYDDEEDY